jgi:hypothetical protein
MKTSQVLISSLALAICLLQIGCKAKVEGEAPSIDIVGPQGGGFDLAAANGNWKTGCYMEKFGFPTETNLDLNNGVFKMTMKLYKHAGCQAADIDQSLSSEGKFVVTRQSDKEAGSYEVNIESDKGNGVTLTQYDLIRLANGKLYMGDPSAPLNGSYPSKADLDKAFTK